MLSGYYEAGHSAINLPQLLVNNSEIVFIWQTNSLEIAVVCAFFILSFSYTFVVTFLFATNLAGLKNVSNIILKILILLLFA